MFHIFAKASRAACMYDRVDVMMQCAGACWRLCRTAYLHSWSGGRLLRLSLLPGTSSEQTTQALGNRSASRFSTHSRRLQTQ